MATDVLLQVDTRALMDTPKSGNLTMMLEDCFDMKFVYYREYEERSGPVWLEYFIESNCGKVDTQIWVRVNISEQLEVATNYSVWMHYAADRSGLIDSQTGELYEEEKEQKLEKKFGGFLFLYANDDPCPIDNPDALTMHGKFLRISDTTRAGEVGLSVSHAHESILATSYNSVGTVCRQPLGTGQYGFPMDLYHTLDTQPISIQPHNWHAITSTINFRPCVSSLDNETIDTIPKDLVVFWDDGGSVPAGYAMYTNPAVTGNLKKLIRFDDVWWESDTDGADILKHAHANYGTIPNLEEVEELISANYIEAITDGDEYGWFRTQSHYHSSVPFPGWDVGEMIGSHLPEVVDLIMLVNQVDNYRLPSGSILPMAASSSVEDIIGWEKVLHSYEERYVRFNDVSPLSLFGSGYHSHSLTGAVSNVPSGGGNLKCPENSTSYEMTRSFKEVSSGGHTHQVDIFTDNMVNVPAYTMHAFLKKKFSPEVQMGDLEVLTFQCFGLDSTHNEACNHHKGWGRCVSRDTCTCKSEGYEVENASGEKVSATIIGKICSEFVSGAYYVGDESISVDYIADIGLITEVNREMEHKFDCGLVLKNPNDVIDDYDEHPRKDCNWEAESLLKTARLNIEGTRSGLTTIDIISFSDQRFLTLTVDPLESDAAWWVVVVVVPIVLALLLLVGIGVFLALLLFGLSSYQKKKLKKFESLDVEMLLKEQQAEAVDDNTAKLNIDQKLFEVNFKDIKIDKKIGAGGSNSIVFVATWEGLKVAFKCFKTQHICSDQNRFNEFEKEVYILSSVKHPHVLRFFGATLHPPRVGILMEFCENGDLKIFLETYKTENAQEYDFFERVRMMKEVASAMKFLHSSKIIHRDLKSENILVTEDFATKVMDFGLSKVVERISMTQTKRVGTSIYMAPEVTRGDKYSDKCDVFSFGMILYEVLHYNFDPYKTIAQSCNLEFKVASNPLFRPPIGTKKFQGEEWLISLIKSSWADRPQERKSFKAIVEIFSSKKNIYVSNVPKRRGSTTANSSNMRKEIERLKRVLEKEQHDQMKLKFDLKRLTQNHPSKIRKDSLKTSSRVVSKARKPPKLAPKPKSIRSGKQGSSRKLVNRKDRVPKHSVSEKVRRGSMPKNPVPKLPEKGRRGSVPKHSGLPKKAEV